MYFSKFPIVTYKINDKEFVLVTDFIKAIQIDTLLKSDSLFSDPYDVLDNETPEIISHKFYGTVDYHWVIMLINERYDFYSDFPKSDDIVRKETLRKFGNLEGIHHYEDENGKIINYYPVLNWPLIRQNLTTDSNFSIVFDSRKLGDFNNDGVVNSLDISVLDYDMDFDTREYVYGTFYDIMISDSRYSNYILYENPNNNDVVIPITNYEYMTALNEEKRTIKILKKEILPEFSQRYLELIQR